MRTLCSFVSVVTVVVLVSIGVAGEQGGKPAKGLALFDGLLFQALLDPALAIEGERMQEAQARLRRVLPERPD